MFLRHRTRQRRRGAFHDGGGERSSASEACTTGATGNPRAGRILRRQLTAWTASIDSSPVQGKRHLTGEVKERREAAQKAKDFRQNFLRNLKPEHPLYQSAEARMARNEAVEE
ncbi:MAG: hypothetical protein WDM80_04150 [Limisphaerales bacterium]